MKQGTVTAYMCKIDWEHDFPDSNDPGRVYANLEDLRAKRKCLDQCGIVEVEVKLLRVVQESSLFPTSTEQ